MPKVFVINQAVHDFSAASTHGKLVYLSRKPMSRYATNNIFRLFYKHLKKSKPDDLILITGLNTMNIIACVIFALMHHKINILIHYPADNTYLKRILSFDTVISDMEKR